MIKKFLIFLLLAPILSKAQVLAPTAVTTKLTANFAGSTTFGSLYYTTGQQYGWLNGATGLWEQAVTGRQITKFYYPKTHIDSIVAGYIPISGGGGGGYWPLSGSAPFTGDVEIDRGNHRLTIINHSTAEGGNIGLDATGAGIGVNINVAGNVKYASTLNLQEADIELVSYNYSNNKFRALYMQTDSTMKIHNDYAGALQYDGNYHAGFTSRSLVDKSYLDSVFAAGINIYNSDGSATSDRTFTLPSNRSFTITAPATSTSSSQFTQSNNAIGINSFGPSSQSAGFFTGGNGAIASMSRNVGIKTEGVEVSTVGVNVITEISNKGLLGDKYYGRNAQTGNQYVQLRLLDSTAKAKADSVKGTIASGVTSVSGTTNRITSTGGSTPVIDISSTFEALLGKVANPLSQFSATTSAQLRGVLSDESGTGNAYFQGGDLGTPSAGVLTNATGTASGLTSGLVTSIGNLTGDIVSTNRATTYNNVVPANKGGAGAITGLLKANGSGTVSAATAGTDYENPLTFSSPLTRSTNTISIPVATSGANGYLSSTDWSTFNGKQGAITLTTTGTSGPSTLVGNTLNIPQYSGSGGMAIGGTVTGGTPTNIPYIGTGPVLAQDPGFTFDSSIKQLTISGTGLDQIVASSSSTQSSGISLTNTSSGGHSFEFFSTGSGNGPGKFGVYDNTSNKTILSIDGTTGNVGFNGITNPTAYISLPAGSAAANTGPFKFTSGPLLTTPVGGTVEFLTDKTYITISTGTARKEYALFDIAGTSGRIPFETTNGRLTDGTGFTYSTAAGFTAPKITGAITPNATYQAATGTTSDSLRFASSGKMVEKLLVQGNGISLTQTATQLTIAAGGGDFRTIVTKTGAYTATASDYTILVDCTAGAVPITLPTASGNTGQILNIKKIDSSANAVTIIGTVDGATNPTIATQYVSKMVQSNGTAYFAL